MFWSFAMFGNFCLSSDREKLLKLSRRLKWKLQFVGTFIFNSVRLPSAYWIYKIFPVPHALLTNKKMLAVNKEVPGDYNFVLIQVSGTSK